MHVGPESADFLRPNDLLNAVDFFDALYPEKE